MNKSDLLIAISFFLFEKKERDDFALALSLLSLPTARIIPSHLERQKFKMSSPSAKNRVVSFCDDICNEKVDDLTRSRAHFRYNNNNKDKFRYFSSKKCSANKEKEKEIHISSYSHRGCVYIVSLHGRVVRLIICLDPFFRFRIDHKRLLDGSRVSSDSFKPMPPSLSSQPKSPPLRGLPL